MKLRDYQSDAVNAVWEYIRTKDGNPCCVLPTGAGKSLVIAQLAHTTAVDWNGRVIILQHVKELIEQNADKLRKLSPDLDIGIYSAGLNRRDKKNRVLVAGIQSVYSKAFELPPFDVIIVDECHLLPPDGDGMYRQFLKDMKVAVPHCRLIGLTATPYRTSSGWLCEPDGLLNDICYEISVKDLIQQGYLSKLISKEPIHLDTSGLHVRGGEFVQDEATALMTDVVSPACDQIIARTLERSSVLIFTQSVDHCLTVYEILKSKQNERTDFVTGETPAWKRAEILADFKAKKIKYLVNINVLTTGFDAPNVDCVCLLRPTLSPGLYYQMVGRGFRLSEGKENCLVLDFAGNVTRHGPVDQIEPKPRNISGGNGDAPTKTCPSCEAICHASIAVCQNCNHEFPDRGQPKHEAEAGTAPITSLEISINEYDVIDTRYYVHVKKADPNGPKSLRVDYQVNLVKWFSEWVCFEHEGFAGNKAKLWWKSRSNDPFPEDTADAKDKAEAGALAQTLKITVQEKAGEKFPRIVKAVLGDKPEAVFAGDDDFEFPTEDNTVDSSWIEELPW